MTDNDGAPALRRRRAPKDRTHTEIYERVEIVERQGAETRQQVDLQTLVLQGIQNDLKGLKVSLATLITNVGNEGADEYGKPIGTGLIGRVMRFETNTRSKFRRYDRWTAVGAGIIGTLSVIGPLLWWLLGDKLAQLLK